MKIKVTRLFVFLIAFYLWVPGPKLLLAAPMTTGADFLLMTTGARPDGMGQAFSAVADDINTLTFNPAGLGNIRLPEAGYGHVNFIAGTAYDFLGAAIPVGSLGVLGFGYVGLGTEPFNSTVDPLASTVTLQDRAFIGGWGKSFYNLHVGAAVKAITRQVDTIQGTGFAFDLGLRYRITPFLTLAGSCLNIGPGIQMGGLEPLPTLLNGGAAFKLLEDSDHTINLTGDSSYNLATNTERAAVGAEYWFRDTVALRGGYLFNSQDEGFSAGAGVQLAFIQLDYAFQPYATLGPVHRFSGLIRWDGPWVSGGEPNPAKYVNVHEEPSSLRLRWEKARGPVESYEVLVQPLDGSETFVSQPVVNPIYAYTPTRPGTLYKISVRSIGHGGSRSFPSEDTYFETSGSQNPSLSNNWGKDQAVPNSSVASGIEGRVDDLGLRLSWTTPPGMGDVRFNLYRRSPQGRIEKVTKEARAANQIWVADTSGTEGWKWIVTIVDARGREGTLGSYIWNPSTEERELLVASPRIRLYASPQANHRVFLDWDKVPYASGYSLFLSRQADGVYLRFKEVAGNSSTLLMNTAKNHEKYYFIIMPKGPDGSWLGKSNEARVEFTEFGLTAHGANRIQSTPPSAPSVILEP